LPPHRARQRRCCVCCCCCSFCTCSPGGDGGCSTLYCSVVFECESYLHTLHAPALALTSPPHHTLAAPTFACTRTLFKGVYSSTRHTRAQATVDVPTARHSRGNGNVPTARHSRGNGNEGLFLLILYVVSLSFFLNVCLIGVLFWMRDFFPVGSSWLSVASRIRGQSNPWPVESVASRIHGQSNPWPVDGVETRLGKVPLELGIETKGNTSTHVLNRGTRQRMC
jgi:hypothetical protein